MNAPQRPRRAALLIAGLSLAGKCLAIGKTLIIASLFGTSSTLDAFWVAYSLPLLLPGLITNTLTVAFVPRFVAGLDGRIGVQAWRGANTLFTLVLAISIVSSTAMYTFSPVIVRTLAPGLNADAHAQAVALSRLMLPCVALLTCTSLLSALSYARERFALPTLEGVVSNIAIIGIALLWARSAGVYALTVGVIVGFCAQALLMIVGNRDLIRTSLRPAFDFTHADLRAPLAHLLPLFVGSAGAILSGLVDQYFVSKLDAGSISALSYAWMFAMLPVEIFAQAVLTSYYPTLARQFAQRDLAATAATYAQGTRFLLALTLPCAILLALLAKPVVVLLLEHGRFDAHSTALTAQAIGVLAFGVVTRAHAYFSYRVLHAALRPWTQIAIGLAGVASCIGLNLLWAQRLGLPGIMLSTVLSSLQSALLSTWAVRRLLDRPMPARFGVEIRCLFLCGGVLAGGVSLGRFFVPESLYLSVPKLWAFVSILCALPAVGAAIFCAWHLGQSELREAGDLIARRWQRMAT
jgi:putative peptidoglycan lipid II flippase